MTSAKGHFESFYLNLKCSDVTVSVTLSGRPCLNIPSHRFVLSSRSPVFEKMFETDSFKEAKSGVVNINVEGGVDVARDFIRFFYFGNVQNRSLSDAVGLLKTSHLYQVDSLVKLSEDNILESLTPDNVCQIYEDTKAFTSQKYSEIILELIIRSAFIIFQNSGHVILSEDAMATILKSDLLNAVNEKQVADALWSWGLWNCLKSGSSANSGDVIARIQNLSGHVRWGLWPELELQASEGPWKPLAEAKTENVGEARTPSSTPSIIKFTKVLELLKNWKSFYYRYNKSSENQNILLKFSTDTNIFLMGLEFEAALEDGMLDKLSESVQLTLDDLDLNLTDASRSTLGVEMINNTKIWSYRFLLEFKKPFLLTSFNHHEIKLKILCQLTQVKLFRYTIGEGTSFLPKKTVKGEARFIITGDVCSVMKLYFVAA